MDCLKINTPSEVTDTSLAKVGELRFDIDISEVKTFFVGAAGIPAEKNTGMYIIGDGHFTDSDGTSDLGETRAYDLFSTTQFWLSPGKYTLVLTQKYYIKALTISFGATLVGGTFFAMDELTSLNIANLVNGVGGIFTPKDFESSTLSVFTSNGIRNIEGKLEDLKLSDSATQFNVANQDIEGDVADLPRTLTLVSLSGNNRFTGDIEDAPLTATTVNVGGTTVYGSLDAYFDAIYANGKTSGTVTVLTNTGLMTLNGTPLYGRSIVATFNAGGWSVPS